MHCIVLFGNEEFAGAGVIKKCCSAKEKTHLMPLLLIPVERWKAAELFVLLQCLENSHFGVDIRDAQNNRAFCPM